MIFHQPTASTFIPDGAPLAEALKRTTHLGIGAHPDDLEIMAAHPILECHSNPWWWFSGVIMTDGRASPRSGEFSLTSDAHMREIRLKEAQRAAAIGNFSALICLDYTSQVLRDGKIPNPVQDLVEIFKATQPGFVYTHNLADSHDTHVVAALRVIAAVRKLPSKKRPTRLYGCEAWRDLEWLTTNDRVEMDLSQHQGIQRELLSAHRSQIDGGKRIDQAAMARRRAHATFFDPFHVDTATGLSYAMDMTPLIEDDNLDPIAFTLELVENFKRDVAERIERFQ